MKWVIKGKYVIEAESKEEARKIGNKQFGHEMEIVSIEKELLRKASSRPVNMLMEIGETRLKALQIVVNALGRGKGR